jgi:hypothetical protein
MLWLIFTATYNLLMLVPNWIRLAYCFNTFVLDAVLDKVRVSYLILISHLSCIVLIKKLIYENNITFIGIIISRLRILRFSF